MFFIIFLLLITSNALKLNLESCKQKSIGSMEFRICDNVEPYSKVYFHDPTGENQITIVPERLYKNHGYYVAYSKGKQLYVTTKKYSSSVWFDHLDQL